jgi:DNA-binding NtrC family response regulator
MFQRITNEIARHDTRQSARLRVVLGPDDGLEVELPTAGVVIGATEESDVALNDDLVSARHCAIKPIAGGFEVRDLSSRNGTYLDDARIERAIVPLGAGIRIGATTLQLLPAESAVELPPSARSTFGGLVGGSLAMRRIYAVLERISASAAPVLLIGESGTGKEVCARAIHDASPRSDGPFVVFDCGAASDNLVESDLFGHVRGAFTGAERDRVGAFAQAHGGTLFLDEIGDLPPKLQPKLLRLLETGESQPLGGTKSARHDVRIVAATHHDLAKEAETGLFRSDLYYRLAVVEIHLPPLRTRLEDLPVLVERLLSREGRGLGDPQGRNLDRLRAHRWPGNVRELRNVVARAVALSPAATDFDAMPLILQPKPIEEPPPSLLPAGPLRPFHELKEEAIETLERGYLTALLGEHGGNLAHAARVAGIERRHLYRLLDKHGLSPREGRKAV